MMSSGLTEQRRPRVAVIQDGARLHYAIPLALQQRRMLHRMYTDWYAAPGAMEQLAGRVVEWFRPLLGRRLLERVNPALDPKLVVRNPWLPLWAALRRRGFWSAEAYYDWYSGLVG